MLTAVRFCAAVRVLRGGWAVDASRAGSLLFAVRDAREVATLRVSDAGIATRTNGEPETVMWTALAGCTDEEDERVGEVAA